MKALADQTVLGNNSQDMGESGSSDHETASRRWLERSTISPDRQDLYLRVHGVVVFVRDQDRSLQFYVDTLGFTFVGDRRVGTGYRWVAVAPPDGSAILVLIAPKPGSDEYKMIGRWTPVAFVTEDLPAKYEQWLARGVRFSHPPREPDWGGSLTSFMDPDGNTFTLLGFDEISREIEQQRLQAARKAESERRAAQEIEIAKEVQARLFPQTLPGLETLDYSGVCMQAREVGGDYYDFLDLGRRHLGLVIGDISGKGIAAALLMANLQANLRSQSAIALDQPERFLQSVNRLFYENTTDSAYATLFFAEYDDRERRLRYANCGHLAALLMRGDGAIERLHSTCTVVGLFKEWRCDVRECQLFPGDILALYTDGITESFDERGEEFGEQRLIESLRRHREMSSEQLLEAVVDEAQQFSPGERHDDVTLIVAKCI